MRLEPVVNFDENFLCIGSANTESIKALVSTLNNTLRKGESLIDWRIVALTAVAAALAAWFGTDLMHKLSNQHLTRLFGIVLVIFGTRMLLTR